MKIGVDGTSLKGRRGLARYTRNILKALLKVDCQNEYYLFSPYNYNGDYQKSKNLHQVFVKYRRSIPWHNGSLPLVVKKYSIDIFFFPANDFWFWRPTNTIVTVHDLAPYLYPEKFFQKKFDLFYDRLQKYLLKFTPNIIVTTSKFSKENISQKLDIPTERIHIIYNAVDEIFLKNKGLFNKFNLKPYILFVGGFDFRKNLGNLFLAYKDLRMRGFEQKLVLIGSSGANRKLYIDIDELIENNDLTKNVFIFENVADNELIGFYQNADLFILPSLIEGFGLPILEAMACSCPVVASKAASIPEVAGDAALFFDPYNVEEMADKMELILTKAELREELLKRGKRRVHLFSWERSARRLLNIFEKEA